MGSKLFIFHFSNAATAYTAERREREKSGEREGDTDPVRKESIKMKIITDSKQYKEKKI